MSTQNNFLYRLGYRFCRQWHDEGKWRGIVSSPYVASNGKLAVEMFGTKLSERSRQDFANGWDKRMGEMRRERRHPMAMGRDREGKLILLSLIFGCALFWATVFKLIF